MPPLYLEDLMQNYTLHVIHNDVETSELRNEGEEYLNNVKAKANEKKHSGKNRNYFL